MENGNGNKFVFNYWKFKECFFEILINFIEDLILLNTK